MNLVRVSRQRHGRTSAVLAAAFALSLTAACGGDATQTSADPAQSGSAAPTQASIAMASTSLAAGPLLAALALDTFSDSGLSLEQTQASGSSTNVVAAVLSGDTEFGFVGGTTAVDAINEGAPIKVIGGVTYGLQQLALRPEVADRLAPVTAESPIADRVNALKGLKIATSAAGSTNNAYLLGILESQGVNPERDVTVVPSEPSAIVAGLRDGLYDGALWSVGVLEPNLSDGSAELWIDIPSGDLPDFKNAYQAVLITSEQTLQEQPGLVKSFLEGARAGSEAVENDAAAAETAVQNEFFPKLDPAAFELAWESANPAFVPNLEVTQEAWANHLKLQGDLNGGDYSDISFEDNVFEGARGEG